MHAGTFTMNWSTGPLQYILEGTYRLVASLLTPDGNTLWSQTFWVQVAAPYFILAAFPIILVLIIIYELYAVATVGRQAALRAQKKAEPLAPPPVEPAPPTPPPPAETITEPPPGGPS
jgi:hypothetical protein